MTTSLLSLKCMCCRWNELAPHLTNSPQQQPKNTNDQHNDVIGREEQPITGLEVNTNQLNSVAANSIPQHSADRTHVDEGKPSRWF